MRTFVAFTVLSLLSCTCLGHELSQSLGNEIAIHKTNKGARVEYCPDNTCETFTLNGAGSEQPIQDFAFVYLFSVSDYIYLESFQSDLNSTYLKSVLARYRSVCVQTDEKIAARCIVGILAKRYPIKASFVRYDEGKKNSSPISLGAYRRGT